MTVAALACTRFSNTEQRQIEEGRLVPSGIDIVVYQIRSAGAGATKWKASAMPLDGSFKQVGGLSCSPTDVESVIEATGVEGAFTRRTLHTKIMKAVSRAIRWIRSKLDLARCWKASVLT